MTQPWIRNIEVTVDPVPEWRSSINNAGPSLPKVIVFTGDGSNSQLRIRFKINKHAGGIQTPGSIEIFNLNPSLRSALQSQGISIIVKAGWGNIPLAKIFSGEVMAAWSRRENANIITTLVCLSGLGTAQQTIAANLSIAPNGPLAAGIIAAANQFEGITVDPKNVTVTGNVGSRGYKFSGLVSDCLFDLARIYGFHWTIIDGSFKAVPDRTPLLGNTIDINSADGFLLRAEPMLFSEFQIQSGIVIHTLLNPYIQCDGVINLTTAINPALNGSYLIWSLTHTGDTHSSQWETITETTLVNNSQGAGFA